MKLSIVSILATAMFTLKCASREGGRPDRNIDLDAEPANSRLKVAGLSVLQIDIKDAHFQTQLEYISDENEHLEFDYQCSNRPCPPGFHISKNGLLTFQHSDGGDQKFNVKIIIGKSGSDKSKWGENFLAVEIGKFNYLSGDYWTRAYKKSITPQLSKFSDVVLGQRKKSDIDAFRKFQVSQLGTAIYLGQYSGKKLVLTPYHVFTSELVSGKAICNGDRLFTNDDASRITTCKRILWEDENYDLTLLEIEDPGSSFPMSANVCLDTEGIFEVGDQLAIVGYGTYRNLSGYKGVSSDSDCRIITQNSSDLLVKGTHFKHLIVACDLSSGDSGGALLNLSKGQLIGTVVGGNRAVTRSSTADIQRFIRDQSGNPIETANAISITIRDFLEALENASANNPEILAIVRDIREKNSNCSS